jgi:hypothetical protein
MAAEDLQLDRITSLPRALDRVPQGSAAYELAKRLGLAAPSHARPHERPAFPRSVSDLSNDQLSDLHALWVSEAGRIHELVGGLNGQKQLLELQCKVARASTRSRLRREWPEGTKAPTATELNDRAEEDEAVIDLGEKLAYVELLLAHSKGALDATTKYLDGLNREIVLRTAQMKARLLG